MTSDGSRTILIIDDDRAVLETSARILRDQGLDVVTWANTLGRLHAMAESRPDLVLLDVNMPLVPGDELMALIQESPVLRQIPVVLFSSNDETDLRRMVRKTGAVGYISKSELGGDFAGRVLGFLPRRLAGH
jgi:CheY-like chemotaxis protein